ncbi:MAG: peptidylprolyl isomerase [Thermoplasmata archaeon]|nr:MAG: peptidylprolyl isomerase [Thermoplasmata archaeon]
MKTVKKGDRVKVEYVGTLEDGTIFDSSDRHETPLEFTVGAGELIKGFDDAVVGMKKDEEKEVKIEPKDAYGEHNPEFVKEMPREYFPEDREIKPGMVFLINLQDGRQIPVRVSKVSDDTVTIDLNPPLAGKTLFFKIKVVEIAEKTTE